MSNKTVNICGIQPSLEEAFKFCWSSWVDQHNILPNLTRRHAKLEKFIFGTPWLPDLLYKHWFASSVWNSCPWVTDVPPRETFPATKSEEKRMFSQAIRVWKKTVIYNILKSPPSYPASWISKINTRMRILFLSRHFPLVRLGYVSEANWQRGTGKTPYRD